MLINLRNALMSGKRIPYDAEVEFLQSTGTQYIDTGIVPNLNTTTKATFAFVGAGLNQALAGSISISGGNITGRYSPIIIGDTGKFAVFTGLSVSTRYDFVNANTNTHTIEFNAPTSHGIIFDGESIGRTVDVVGNCNSLTICRRNYDASALPASVKIFGLQIYQSGVLVRDFIPVRKGTVGYFYDRVTGKLFGNAGTGDFVVGPDVVPVEYIESHGTEWIDTGVAASNDLSIEFLLYNLTQSQNSLCPVGVFDNSSGSAIRYSLLANSGGIYYFYCGTSTSVDGKSIPFEQWVRFTMSGFTLTWQASTTSGTYTVPKSPDFHVNTTMSLFARHRMLNGVLDYDAFWSGKIAACKIYKNGVLVRDFIPVRKGTVGYLYDRVTRKLFGNAGTGAFTYGNDLRYPIPAS